MDIAPTTAAPRKPRSCKLRNCKKCGVLFQTRDCAACKKRNDAKYRAENKDKINATKAKYREKNREKIQTYFAAYRGANLDRIKEVNAAYYAANAKAIRAKNLEWDMRNKERLAIAKRVWKLANQETKAVYRHNRRARLMASGGVLSKGLASKLFGLQKGLCACCRQPLGDNYHLDHIFPLALGGANEDWNMQLLRAKCNNEKNARHPVDFMQMRGFLL